MNETNNSTIIHDIFISYRRDGGVDLAARIKEFLIKKNYSVFMDIEDLKSGQFNKELLNKIEKAQDIIIVLTKDCLKRCKNEDDWLRTEISHALKNKKNLIPVFASGFQMPDANELPIDIKELVTYQRVNSYSDLFEESMSKLASEYLNSKPKNKFLEFYRNNFKRIRSIVFVSICVLLLIFLIKNCSNSIKGIYHKVGKFISSSDSAINESLYFSKKYNLQWFMQTTEGPTYRNWFAMAYDPIKQHIILHGGWGVDYSVHRYVRGGPSNVSETWIWKDSKWEKSPNKNLAIRRSAMAFDKKHEQMILFGGLEGGLPYNLTNKTWTWSNDGWIRVSNTGPQARHSHAVVFDEQRQTVILFGGQTRQTNIGQAVQINEVPLGDMWEWNGTIWSRLHIKCPEPRWGHQMVYDIKYNTVVLFGGYDGKKYFNETWVWDGAQAKWSKAILSQSPTARYQHNMVYDSSKDVILLFGGKTEGEIAVNDLWEWKSLDWYLIELDAPPSPRYDFGMVYDILDKTTILFGGSDGKEEFRDTWKLTFYE